MCMEDVRISRRTRTTENSVSLTTTPVVIVDHNPNRIGLFFGGVAGGDVTISRTSTFGTGAGIIFMPAGFPSRDYNYLNHPGFVTEKLFARVAVGTGTINVMEEVLEDQ